MRTRTAIRTAPCIRTRMCIDARRRLLAAITIAVCMLASAVAQADTVASLLGNFTINQFTALRVEDGGIAVRHSIVFGQLPALRELHAADADRDGVTSAQERDAHARRLVDAFADELRITVEGVTVPLRPVRAVTSLPDEQGGFSLRMDLDFAGVLAADRRPRTLRFANEVYAGRFGWQEIQVQAARGISVFDTDAFSTSLTEGLVENITELPATGPLAERTVQLAYTTGPLPPGAVALGPRPQAAPRAAAQASGLAPDPDWLRVQTRALVDRLANGSVDALGVFHALLAALVLGALHAFSPGHGKTVVGAYLIGSRATARHAAFLGLTVTVTHTLGVFALGLATLAASAYVLPERLFPILGLASGLIVLAMGVVLLKQRWPQARASFAPRAAATAFRALRTMSGGHVLASVNRAHADLGWHSHGGTWHTHLPPGAGGEPVTWRGLLALGVSGGLVPCPSAMVLLLAATALNRTGLGLLLVVAFSAGLALTLTAIGLVFLYARNRIPTGARAPRWTRVVPVASAAAITLLGVLLCYGALNGTQV